MARPRGGDWLFDELASLQEQGVTDIVSLLTQSEIDELQLENEARISAALGLRFHHHPIPDRGLPTQPAFDQFIDTLVPLLQQGRFLVFHCRAGIGRSSIAAAACLIRLGVTPTVAIRLISHARGLQVPDTDKQHAFILSLPYD